MKTSLIPPVILCLLIFLFSCRKSFTPNIISTNLGYLVVEGVINSGSDSTIVKLSRTVLLNANTRNPETKARVVVESDKNDQFVLTEVTPGTYVVLNLNLPTNRKYRIHIFTPANKEYTSDFVENKITPPIDSISYKVLSASVQFYVNTHDQTNKTRYYRWEYGEAWSYYSAYNTVLAYKDGAVVGRSATDTPIDYCYKYAIPDNNVFVSTSEKLEQDEIYKFPLGYTAGDTWRFQSQYGLTVREYALTQDAYRYYQLLKTNTEQLGSIFDAQPTTALTNLHCITDPNEPVIGYISVSTVSLKRLFFTNRDFPFRVIPPISLNYNCATNRILIDPISSFSYRLRLALGSADSLVVDFVRDPITHQTIGYTYAAAPCVDCRLDGGTNIKPSYWPF